MMRIISLFLFIVVASGLFAQSASIELKASIRDDNTGKSLGGATIEVYKGGVLFAKESSSSNGKVNSIDLPVCIGCTYTVKIKKGGYVTKTAIVDGHSDYPEEMPPGTIVQKFDVSIFESVEGIDFSFLDKEPMIEFRIDSYGMVNFDQKKVNQMLKKIENLKKQMEEKKEQLEKEAEEKAKREADFNAYVKAGDDAVGKEDYEKGIGQYELALGIKADDKPTQDKLENAKRKLAEQKANAEKDAEFSAAMAKGKQAYKDENLQEALDNYNAAALIKPDEKLPKDLIAEIEAKIAKLMESEAAFRELVKEGDAAVTAENYDEAITKYEAAFDLKKDSEVEAKLSAAKKKKEEKEAALAEAKELQKKYDDLLAKADADFDTEKYDEAKKSYEEALKIKPEENKPKDKIAAIDTILKERAADAAAKEKLEADYQKIIDEANAKIAQREWESAKQKYEEALNLKPNDEFALAQIELMNLEITKAAESAKKDEEYNTLMDEANRLFDEKKYAEAKAKYGAASGVKPQEQQPKDRMAEIERLVSDAEKLAEQEEKYTALMTEGTALQDNKDYTAAIDRYNQALEIKPDDATAKAKIDAVNKILEEERKAAEEQAQFDEYVAQAEQSFNAKDYDKAKLNYNNALGIKDDAEIKEKIKAIDDLIAKNQSAAETQAKYDAAIKEADALYTANDNEAALEKYTAALSIKEENYPKERISELTEKIEAAQAEAAIEKEFNDLVTKADELYANEDYSEALTTYKNAIKVKPDPSITKKIAELNTRLAEMSQNAEKKANYDAKIAEADVAFEDKNWGGARALYQEASAILPAESYPDDQIEEIERQMAAEATAEIEKNYQKIIDKADGLRDDGELDEALSYYNRAVGLKPSDNYPKEEIDKINTQKQNEANALADQKKLNEEYTALIQKGDEAFNAENWTAALEKYQKASGLKPAEVYPKDRVAEIQAKLNDADAQRLKDEEYDKFITEGDRLYDNQEYTEAKTAYTNALNVKANEQYPKDQIELANSFLKKETENEVEAAYQKMLSTAQEKFDEKDYERALELYLRAKTTKPSDPFPQQRIDEINQIIAKEKDAEALRQQFDDYILEADNQYEKGNWKSAKESYTKAFNLFPEEYPERRIKECTENMQEATANEVDKNYQKIISKADDYFNDANYEKAKGLYQRAVGIKPSDQYPVNRLDEINKLQNPSKFANTKTNLKDYGNPNRSANAVDVDAMLADAEAQRKFNTAQKVQAQRLEAEEAEKLDDIAQTDDTYATREKVIELRETYEDDDDAAEQKRVAANAQVEGMEDELSGNKRQQTVNNENDVQLQSQRVNNINREIEQRDVESDLEREEYEANVERIRSEIVLESELENSRQTNETYTQKEYIEREKENFVESDLNNDIDRKNTEVYIEDASVEIINARNENVWTQEDEVLKIKEQTEDLKTSYETEFADSELKRVEVISDVEDQNLEQIRASRTREDEQYDVTIDGKIYTEKIRNEIEIENIGNDIPREKMEDFVEKERLENNDASTTRSTTQTNDLFATENYAESLELEIEEKEKRDDKKREGYETEVDKMKEEEDAFVGRNTSESENEMYATVDYVQDNEKDRINRTTTADDEADANIDKTQDKVEDMNDAHAEVGDDNQAAVENVEDFVESLRDIKVNEINPTVQNSLGDQFPEGVTEEIYTINDEDGLLSSYIVRRVVVRNGTGDVYEKVQTKFGTSSYTRNGTAITEYQWQDETEAADLVRN